MARSFLLTFAVVIGLAGCAGMGTDYDTPAEAGQIPFSVKPITATLVSGMRVELPSAAAPPTGSIPTGDYAYRIGPSDILAIYVDQPLFDDGSSGGMAAAPGQAAEEALYVVNDQGEIFLPLHGPLDVSGLTMSEAYSRIREALARFITEPQINVRVAEYRSQRVVVATSNGVGSYLPITDQAMTIVDAVLLGGESVENADLRSVVLKRNGRDIPVDVKALMDSGAFGQDWTLQSGDVLVVPENRSAVYLAGEAPNIRLDIDPYETTLAEVMFLGGGQGNIAGQLGGQYMRNGSTRIGSVFVIRGDTEFADVYHLNAKTPDALILAEQFPMQHGDIVFVSTNPVTRFNRFISETLPSLAPLFLAEYIID